MKENRSGIRWWVSLTAVHIDVLLVWIEPLDIQKSLLCFLKLPMFTDRVFYLKVELHTFPFEIQIAHTVHRKTGNIKICWLECQFYVKKLSSLTFSFCSTPKDWHRGSTPQVPSSRHSWAWWVTSEEISNESSSFIWHLLTGFPSLGLSSHSVVCRDRWSVLAWLPLSTYAYIYCFRIFIPLWHKVHLRRWIVKGQLTFI